MKKLFKTIICTAVVMFFATSFYSCGGDGEKNLPDDTSALEFEFGDHQYKVVKYPSTWVNAAKDAVAQGGYLVQIGSLEEQNAVYKGIQDAGVASDYIKVNDGGGVAYVWIGATDRAQEGTWLWNGANATGTIPMFWYGNNTGTAISNSYVNWGGKSKGKFNEPDNYTDATYSPNGQNAAAIGLASWPAGSSSPLGIAGEWNDLSETNLLYYVIEFGEDPAPPAPVTITYNKAKGTYGGNLMGTGTAAFIIDMCNAADTTIGITMCAFSALPANFASFSPVGTYTGAETGAVNTFFPGSIDNGEPWATFVYNKSTKKYTLIKSGTLTISGSGATYTVTTDFKGVDSNTNADVNDLLFKYTGAITFTDASSWKFADINGSYTATGTPNWLTTPGASTWKGTITPKTDNGQYYAISNFGDKGITVFCDYKNDKIFIDDYTSLGGNTTLDAYFKVGYFNGDTFYFLDGTTVSPKYNQATKTLDFSGTYNGYTMGVGVFGKNKSTGSWDGVFSDVYANLKLVLTSVSSSAPMPGSESDNTNLRLSLPQPLRSDINPGNIAVNESKLEKVTLSELKRLDKNSLQLVSSKK